MSKVQPRKAWRSREQADAAYTCKDGVAVHCRCETIEIDDRTNMTPDMDEMMEMMGRARLKNTLAAPKNGVLRRPG